MVKKTPNRFSIFYFLFTIGSLSGCGTRLGEGRSRSRTLRRNECPPWSAIALAMFVPGSSNLQESNSLNSSSTLETVCKSCPASALSALGVYFVCSGSSFIISWFWGGVFGCNGGF